MEGYCCNCAHVRKFKPRKDEKVRYGFGDIGYGCNKSGFEGYTQSFSSCNFFHPIKTQGEQS